MLGYGALGRETARLLKSHGMRVIAANTSGKATTQDGVSNCFPPSGYASVEKNCAPIS
jgi:phosphoglycerate dehydrogenase-like enzyme